MNFKTGDKVKFLHSDQVVYGEIKEIRRFNGPSGIAMVATEVGSVVPVPLEELKLRT